MDRTTAHVHHIDEGVSWSATHRHCHGDAGPFSQGSVHQWLGLACLHSLLCAKGACSPCEAGGTQRAAPSRRCQRGYLVRRLHKQGAAVPLIPRQPYATPTSRWYTRGSSSSVANKCIMTTNHARQRVRRFSPRVERGSSRLGLLRTILIPLSGHDLVASNSLDGCA
jgi:hypothetical protein